jgi:DNA-binding protein HU-beta
MAGNKAKLDNLLERMMDIGAVASKKEAREKLDAVSAAIRGLIREGYDVPVPGLGTLKRRTRSARTGRNPQTGETVQIQSKTTVILRPSKDLIHFL